jgi:hypothetical protein
MAPIRTRRIASAPSVRLARPVATPRTGPRTHLFAEPPALSEIIIEEPGYLPERVLLQDRSPGGRRRSVGPLVDLPSPAVDAAHGAIDALVLDRNGLVVKTGTAVLTGGERQIVLDADPVTRRFRGDRIPAGGYRLSVAAARSIATTDVEIRADDVVRRVVTLADPAGERTGDVVLRIKGAPRGSVRIRATDEATGGVVFDDSVQLVGGIARLSAVPFGRLHWSITDGDRESCYDEDHNPLRGLVDRPVVILERVPRIPPEPPDWHFGSLDRAFAGIAPLLTRLGIGSIEDLAAMEPEGLMHRADSARKAWEDPVDRRLLSEAIDDARRKVGARTSEGELVAEARLARAGTISRRIRPAQAGTVELLVELDGEKAGEVTVRGLEQPIRQAFTGRTTLQFAVSPAQVAAGHVFEISVANASRDPVAARVVSRLPSDVFGPIFHIPSVVDNIEAIYADLATANPGLGTDQPAVVMAPENIRMWLDRARSFMVRAGVCSIDDLGPFRLDPARVFRPGAYVAPARPSLPLTLQHYAFVARLATNVYHYRPNDILHHTAVVLAGEWDIRGQTVVIGADVRELLVVAASIRYDGASRVTWETPPLANANAYWPNPAPSGASGASPGEAGGDGGDGDANPHPSRNGGANAVTPAPIVTMYLLDATGGLPPIDLGGQDGGAGGRGQDGGRGGDGQTGLRADGSFFGGCCRGVGWGGKGGDGGDAGRGGQGGAGGEGGKMTFLTTPASIAALAIAPPPIDISPGAGGPGGPPGSLGAGGIGGPAGTADCETWCDDHPERHGANGNPGATAGDGVAGPAGPAVVSDAFQILPITPEQWTAEFDSPHILDATPDDVEPGETVTIVGEHFDPTSDRIFFDGSDLGAVASATAASFTVPTITDGGYHPIVIRPSGATSRRSNRVLVRVVPLLDDIPAGTRWPENANVTLTGLAFKAGLQVLAEDRSVTPVASFSLPVVGVTRTAIDVQVPGGFLGGLRGVRRIVVRNPDGGQSRAERVARISQTVVVRCAAFRVVGTTSGVGTSRSAADIAALFTEGAVGSISIPWGPADIVFRLVQPVGTVTVADDVATTWPFNGPGDKTLYASGPGVDGAMNFFFFRDVEFLTAYADFGGGPLFIGDEGSDVLGAADFQHVVAHETGHALCLRHICDGGEGAGTFFNHSCDDGDKHFLMYPFWPCGNDLDPGQFAPARIGASNFEDGKTASLPTTSLFMGNNAIPQCMAADTQN